MLQHICHIHAQYVAAYVFSFFHLYTPYIRMLHQKSTPNYQCIDTNSVYKHIHTTRSPRTHTNTADILYAIHTLSSHTSTYLNINHQPGLALLINRRQDTERLRGRDHSIPHQLELSVWWDKGYRTIRVKLTYIHTCVQVPESIRKNIG